MTIPFTDKLSSKYPNIGWKTCGPDGRYPEKNQGPKIINPPAGYPPGIRRISGGGMRISSVFLTNERRAEGIKDLTKQQGLPSKYF